MNGPFKKHLANPHQPKNTQITVHRGKGASERPLQSGTSMNNYAKATPMAQPTAPSPMGGMDNDPDDLPS